METRHGTQERQEGAEQREVNGYLVLLYLLTKFYNSKSERGAQKAAAENFGVSWDSGYF